MKLVVERMSSCLVCRCMIVPMVAARSDLFQLRREAIFHCASFRDLESNINIINMEWNTFGYDPNENNKIYLLWEVHNHMMTVVDLRKLNTNVTLN